MRVWISYEMTGTYTLAKVEGLKKTLLADNRKVIRRVLEDGTIAELKQEGISIDLMGANLDETQGDMFEQKEHKE